MSHSLNDHKAHMNEQPFSLRIQFFICFLRGRWYLIFFPTLNKPYMRNCHFEGQFVGAVCGCSSCGAVPFPLKQTPHSLGSHLCTTKCVSTFPLLPLTLFPYSHLEVAISYCCFCCSFSIESAQEQQFFQMKRYFRFIFQSARM